VWAERPLLHWIYIAHLGDKGVGVKRSKFGWRGGDLLGPHHGSCKQKNKHSGLEANE
jgi:hypothetical protein